MTVELLAAVVGAGVGLATGGLGPRVLRRLPEPELDARPPEGEEEDGSRFTIRPVYEKLAYAELARSPWTGPGLALVAGAVGALLGARLGWTPSFAVTLAAVPTGVWLGYIDLRTTFLPTRLIYPTLLLVALAVLVAGGAGGDWDDVLRAGAGCLAYGGFFFAMHQLTPGIGFGDVRLAFVLGLMLGFLGWYEFTVGVIGAQFLGGFGGGLLALLKVIDPRRNPFGPYMLAAAVAGACWGPQLLRSLGY